MRFWFGEAGDRERIADRIRFWFQGGEGVDRAIQTEFAGDVERAAAGRLDRWKESARGRLALIILLDQFSRNIYRDTPGAFANDAQARELCLEGLRTGVDRDLGTFERAFFYLPLEHSEDIALQERSVRCFQELLDGVGPEWKETFSSFLDYAVRHRDVVKRFGRFPHRNEILGRASTPEETEFLRQPGSSF
ncbi:MAG: DUF924 domain-containing protein [Candidatus Tectomicrobia bacterium]|uniref:DUF924 domain-containing protein n=1 Tax=Tectimicrobiota bacterium TaxID=2528274 RepID=A0A932M1F2_UNCTE|nr:DUF924 domain-containing protein [Candidatus Tectomicrobia bacterium]